MPDLTPAKSLFPLRNSARNILDHHVLTVFIRQPDSPILGQPPETPPMHRLDRNPPFRQIEDMLQLVSIRPSFPNRPAHRVTPLRQPKERCKASVTETLRLTKIFEIHRHDERMCLSWTPCQALFGNEVSDLVIDRVSHAVTLTA